MSFDVELFRRYRTMPTIGTCDFMEIRGVRLEMPMAGPKVVRQRHRDWQRRVVPDLLPDSPNADAAERTPFRVLSALTTAQRPTHGIDAVFEGEFGPLEPLFRAETKSTSQRKMTLAFHVLAVRAADKSEGDAKGFTERTVLLLCRLPDGSLDEPLVRNVVEQFRRAPRDLDLAQRTVLERIQAHWSPSMEPKFATESTSLHVRPFDSTAAQLFRQDLQSLLDAGLQPADFFQNLNLLLTLHLGLYQARLASVLNPQMDELYRQLEDPHGSREAQIRDIEERSGEPDRHPFTRSLWCRAPDPGMSRTATIDSLACRSFKGLEPQLTKLHFSLIMLGQFRRLGKAYLANLYGAGDAYASGRLEPELENEIDDQIRPISWFASRIADDDEFGPFLHEAFTALCARFIDHQIPSTQSDQAEVECELAPSAAIGLRQLYERYNLQTAKNATASRAYRQGMQVTSSLLKNSEMGLLQSRSRVGGFFELGSGTLPLLLLLAIGTREKAPVEHLWKRLGLYGLNFDATERTHLLAQLRAMGVFERYSDSGDAAYVRNLIMAGPPS